jgi:lipopolysaccharide export system protein LptA
MTHRDKPARLFGGAGAILLLLGVAGPLAAAPAGIDARAPISIEADRASIDEPSGVAVYRGGVVLVQGGLKLRAEELTVEVRDGRAVKAVALGKPALLDQAATPQQEASHAEASKMTFLIEQDRMLLDDRASLRQGGRLFQGAHIDYDVVNRRVNASGGENSRVLLVLPAAGDADADKEKDKDAAEKDRKERPGKGSADKADKPAGNGTDDAAAGTTPAAETATPKKANKADKAGTP